MTELSYRPDVDGLRAVAVGLVIVQHAGLAFTGGFVGVDVFFVISGFLITRLILSGCDAGTFSLKNFWLRRVRRILPAAALVVATTLAVGTVLLWPRELAGLADSAVAQQLGLANVYFWSHGTYFDLPSERSPLLHTWSLAVEEQFYLVWPVLMAYLYRKSRRAVAAVVCLIVAVTLPFSELVTRADPSPAFYSMPTRAWELLLGAGVLFLPAAVTGRFRGSVLPGLAGLGLILYAALTYTSLTPFPGLSALAPCLGTALLLGAPARRAASVTGLLSLGPVVAVGRASYSIYLWHWPLLVFARARYGDDLSRAALASIVLAGLAVGGLSYRLVENPVRTRRVLAGNGGLLLTFGLAAAVLCVSGYSLSAVLHARYDGFVAAVGRPDPATLAGPWSQIFGKDCPVSDYGTPLGVVPDDRRPPEFVLWGDSHATAVAPLCDELARARGVYGPCLARGGFAPLVGVWCNKPFNPGKEVQFNWNWDVVEWVRNHKVRHVLMVSRWESKVPPPSVALRPEYPGLVCDLRTAAVSREDAVRVWEESFPETVAALEDAGARLWFVRQIPAQKANPPERPTGAALRGITRREYLTQQAEIDRVLASCRSPALTVVGPGACWFDGEGYSPVSDAEAVFYRDADHVSARGAELFFRPVLEPVFAEMAASSAAAR